MDRWITVQTFVVVPFGIALGGCSITSAPSGEIAEAERAVVAAAAGMGAQDNAQLQRARHKVSLAHRWIAAKDYRPALWLAEQALVDAELAAAEITLRQAGALGGGE